MKQKFQMPTGETVEKDMPQWKTPWNHDTNFESDRTALYCDDESLAKQEFKDECDINIILKRFTRTGEAPPIVLPEHFADLTTRTSYYELSTKIAQANELFYELPAEKRATFLNDPNRWADAVVQATEAGNADRLEALGVDLTAEMRSARARQSQAADQETPSGEHSSTTKTSQKPSETSKTDADNSASKVTPPK